jgi:hypothetical protein
MGGKALVHPGGNILDNWGGYTDCSKEVFKDGTSCSPSKAE